jgi:Ca-activated chloride channel homolog
VERAFVAAGLLCALVATSPAQEPQPSQPFTFKTGVDLIYVTATVTGRDGHFVPGLVKEDFRLFEDGVEQDITHFSAERVPVSLGLVVDSSRSMEGEKWRAARKALSTLLLDLLNERDEVFLVRFETVPEVVEGWTADRLRVANRLGAIRPRGATALYDAASLAVPIAQRGRHRKKALVLISDGNDTSSKVPLAELRKELRQTEVLVYAIGIDTPRNEFVMTAAPSTAPAALVDDPVNIPALRDISDDSGGRTEIISHARDLDPATRRIADELSQQYSLGYPAPGKKDGRWHEIRVEVRDKHRVRARRGYMAPQ